MKVTERKTIYTLSISKRVETPGGQKAGAVQEAEPEQKPKLLTAGRVVCVLILIAIFGVGVLLNLVKT